MDYKESHDSDEELRSLVKKAETHFQQKQYSQAISFGEKALAIIKKNQEHSFDIRAQITNNLAIYYTAAGNFEKAERLYQRSLEMWEKEKGAMHPDVAMNLYNLAGYYVTSRKFKLAIPYLVRAISIWEESLGPDHRDVIESKKKLASIYWKVGNYSSAEKIFKNLIALLESSFASKHPSVASCLNDLGTLYAEQGKYAKAEPLFRKALNIGVKNYSLHHPEVAVYLDNLCALYKIASHHAKDLDPFEYLGLKQEENRDEAEVLFNCGLHLTLEGKIRGALRIYRAARRRSDPHMSLEIERRIAILENEILIGRTGSEPEEDFPLIQ